MPHAHDGTSALAIAPTLALLLIAFVYLRTWLASRSNGANSISGWRAGSFFLGLFLIWVALGSPLAALDHERLTVHMIQHLLLMTLGPPLVWLGAPAAAQRLRAFTSMTVCWLFAAVVLIGWHVPAIFTLAMQSPGWHAVQRASFLGSGLLFWLPVVQSASSLSTGPRWSIILYLYLATLPCDVLSAFLVFSERVAYPIYISTSGRSAESVLADQECAGALMWTCVIIVYLVPGAILATRWLAAPLGGEQTLPHASV